MEIDGLIIIAPFLVRIAEMAKSIVNITAG
jgi:hypothetical protein